MMCITLAAAAYMAESGLAKEMELAQVNGSSQFSIAGEPAMQSYLAQTIQEEEEESGFSKDDLPAKLAELSELQLLTVRHTIDKLEKLAQHAKNTIEEGSCENLYDRKPYEHQVKIVSETSQLLLKVFKDKADKNGLHEVLKDPAFKKYKKAIDLETSSTKFDSKSQLIKFDDKLKAMIMVMKTNNNPKNLDMLTMKYVMRDLYWMRQSFADPGQSQKAMTMYGAWAEDCYNTQLDVWPYSTIIFPRENI